MVMAARVRGLRDVLTALSQPSGCVTFIVPLGADRQKGLLVGFSGRLEQRKEIIQRNIKTKRCVCLVLLQCRGRRARECFHGTDARQIIQL